MGLTAAAFVMLVPEYAGETNVLYINAALARAAARMGGPDYTVWGQPSATPGTTPANVDVAQACLAAHYLQVSPVGASTVLGANPGGSRARTPYLDQFEELMESVAGGFAVSGVVV